jgi:hypothetical protein
MNNHEYKCQVHLGITLVEFDCLHNLVPSLHHEYDHMWKVHHKNDALSMSSGLDATHSATAML